MGGVFYPQAAVQLKIRWEDFGDKNAKFERFYDLPVIPKSVNVHINDYTQADTFDLELDYKNFPFDPRAIRACGVKIYMDNVGQFYGNDGKLVKMSPRRENCVFMGFADEESISFNDTKRTVRMEGRDFTALLIDQKYPHGTLNVEQRLDVVLEGILKSWEATREIGLDNRVWTIGKEELPALSKFWSEKDKLGGRVNIQDGKSYWEVIQEIVGRAGLIAYMELDKLVLSKPRVLYKDKSAKVFVYGRNVSSLDYKRKIGRMKGFNVVIRSLNLNTKEVIQAKIPAEATAEWSKETGIPNTEVKQVTLKPDGTPVDLATHHPAGTAPGTAEPAHYLAFRVPEVADKTQLIKIGQEIYEEISRQQIEGNLETKDMQIPDAILSDGKFSSIRAFDVLQLRVGTPIRVEIDQTDMQRMSRFTTSTARRQYLVSVGYPQDVAAAFADSVGRFDSVFYTKAATFTMGADNGFKCKVDFVNFVQIPEKYAGGGNG